MKTKEERAALIDQVNANARIENFEPDAEDKALQQQFIEGEISWEDLLAHAHEFATRKPEGKA